MTSPGRRRDSRGVGVTRGVWAAGLNEVTPGTPECPSGWAQGVAARSTSWGTAVASPAGVAFSAPRSAATPYRFTTIPGDGFRRRPDPVPGARFLLHLLMKPVIARWFVLASFCFGGDGGHKHGHIDPGETSDGTFIYLP